MSQLAESLCQSCGLCCNGALFDVVPLAPEERDNALGHSLRVVNAPDGRIGFMQPCSAFGGNACTIYEARPERCRQFRCHLLGEVERGVVAPTQARELVGDMKKVLRELDDALGPPVPGSPPLPLRARMMERGDQLSQTTMRTMLTYESLKVTWFEADQT